MAEIIGLNTKLYGINQTILPASEESEQIEETLKSKPERVLNPIVSESYLNSIISGGGGGLASEHYLLMDVKDYLPISVGGESPYAEYELNLVYLDDVTQLNATITINDVAYTVTCDENKELIWSPEVPSIADPTDLPSLYYSNSVLRIEFWVPYENKDVANDIKVEQTITVSDIHNVLTVNNPDELEIQILLQSDPRAAAYINTKTAVLDVYTSTFQYQLQDGDISASQGIDLENGVFTSSTASITIVRSEAN